MKTSDARKLYIADMEAMRAAGIRRRAMRSLLKATQRYPAGEFNEPDEGRPGLVRSASGSCQHH